MEHWNLSIHERPADGRESLYEQYVRILGETKRTLDDVQLFSYIECYGGDDNEKRTHINRIKNARHRSEAVKIIEGNAPTYETHKKAFKKKINQFLNVIGGSDYTLESCGILGDISSTISYEIRDDEALFFLYLFLTSKCSDAKNFLHQNFDKVSEDYLNELKCGAQILLENHKNSMLSEGLIHRQFDIKFKGYQKGIMREYELLEHFIKDLALLEFDESVKREDYQKYIDIIRYCQKELLELKQKVSAPIDLSALAEQPHNYLLRKAIKEYQDYAKLYWSK